MFNCGCERVSDNSNTITNSNEATELSAISSNATSETTTEFPETTDKEISHMKLRLK